MNYFFSSYSNLERILFTNIHPTPVPQSLNHYQEISHSPVTRNPDMHTLNLRYRSLACIYYFIKCAGPYIIITHTRIYIYAQAHIYRYLMAIMHVWWKEGISRTVLYSQCTFKGLSKLVQPCHKPCQQQFIIYSFRS